MSPLCVKVRGDWNGDFSDSSATVACRQLGLDGPGRAVPNAARVFGEGKGPQWLSRVVCMGTEPGLEYCAHEEWGKAHAWDPFGKSVYLHYEDIGIVCNGGTLP